MKIKMKANVTRKQFEKAIITHQFKNLKFGYTKMHNSTAYTPAHNPLEFVLPEYYSSDIIIINGATYIFFACEGVIDLSSILTSPDKKGTLFVIEKEMSIDEVKEFFEKFINSKYMMNIMDDMRKKYEDEVKNVVA